MFNQAEPEVQTAEPWVVAPEPEEVQEWVVAPEETPEEEEEHGCGCGSHRWFTDDD